jgi:hypothetical protein
MVTLKKLNVGVNPYEFAGECVASRGPFSLWEFPTAKKPNPFGWDFVPNRDCGFCYAVCRDTDHTWTANDFSLFDLPLDLVEPVVHAA